MFHVRILQSIFDKLPYTFQFSCLQQQIVHMLRQIFSIDNKFWTPSQFDQVSLFFRFNTFFSKFYQNQDFQKIIDMCYYAKVQKKIPLVLQNSKKPWVIVLLSGKIDILKKVYSQNIKKPKKIKKDIIKVQQTENYVQNQLFKTLTQQNQTAEIGFDCQINVIDDNDAGILYVPMWIFQQHMKIVENRGIELILKELIRFYPRVQQKTLINLAKNGCSLKELKINDYVYKIGSQPLEVYFLLQGSIRLQKHKNQIKKSFIEAVNIQCPSIFGEKDIKLLQRLSSVIVCSAYAKILAINKKYFFINQRMFLRFARQNHIDLKFQAQSQEKNIKLPLLKSNRNSLYSLQQQIPKLIRFSSNNQIGEKEKLIQIKLMRDCHVLVNLSPKKSRTSRFDSVKNDNSKDYTKDQFQQKIKLFHKIRPNAKKIDLNNPIINLTLTKGYNSFRNSFANLSN